MSGRDREESDKAELAMFAALERLLDQLEEMAHWLAPWDGDGYDYILDRFGRRQDRWRYERRLAARAEAPPRPKPYAKQPIPRDLARRVMERDAYRCKHCGTWLNLTVDHIVPERHGGTLDFDNLQTLCQSCNSKKGSRS